MYDSQVIIYQTEDGTVSVDVQLSEDTVWLSLNQLSDLFGRDKSVISRHLKNIFQTGELEKSSTVANFATVQTEGGHTVERQIDYYNLDAILSVGYRVNSKRGTQFRKWASQVLKDHLIRGYSLNHKRLTHTSLQHLQQTITLLSQTLLNQQLVNERGADVLSLIQAYTKTWDILLRYDEDRFELASDRSSSVSLFSYSEAQEAIQHLKDALVVTQDASSLFGQEREDSLKSILGNLEQTFEGKPLYPSTEEKAAHLLYFIIKDHPFLDGNKRIGSLLFLLYLKKANKALSQINDNGLIALALLIAESAPAQKEMMVKLIQNLLQ